MVGATHVATEATILTTLDSGKPVGEFVVDRALWCISCRPVQMTVQMQSLDAASCTPRAITATISRTP